ncbi:uncharacterized protein LOC134275820 [Saccostrea cucullata]|uniref:uncharacterized protein LOC134275820 n=1 Tax=Saccostrea cuccullata TaxID=36930 RepID=UPI002ED21C92
MNIAKGDDHRYEELWGQPTKTRKVEQISIEHPTTSRRSLKHVLAVLLFIILVCGLATTCALYGLEKRKPEENQQCKALAEDKFSNDPCRGQKLKSTSHRNKELGSRGYSFLVSFFKSHGSKTNRTIFVTSETDFNLTFSLPETQSSSLISISSRRSGNITMKKLNVHYSLVPSYFTPEYKGIIINTSVPSSVLTHHSYQTSSDTTTVFPIDNLSTFYIISTSTPANSK